MKRLQECLAYLKANLEYLWDRYGDGALLVLAIAIRMVDLALLLIAFKLLNMTWPR